MNDPADDAVREFLGGESTTQELREMREALLKRLAAMEDDLAARPDDERLLARIRTARRQVAVLAEEETITGFVEDTVRASVMDDMVPLPGDIPAPPTAEIERPAWANEDIDDVPET